MMQYVLKHVSPRSSANHFKKMVIVADLQEGLYQAVGPQNPFLVL